jgi:glycosyltransferase involved in cell wall biosynthesis
MLVSVITPVFNAESYIRKAVESALIQPETGEVLLIEDGSPDNSLEECLKLDREYDKVKLLLHSDGKNHGAGASRNLGIKNASYEYIAFLDADDFFLPKRFEVAKKLFKSDPELEGVYEAVGNHFENESARQFSLNKGLGSWITMSQRVDPKNLFEKQAPVGDCGCCQTDGWVVKKSVFNKTGLFDEKLYLHQDTAMFVKFSAVCKMISGRLYEPVAMRRVHNENRMFARRSPLKSFKNRILMWGTLWKWGKYNLDAERQLLLLERIIKYTHGEAFDQKRNFLIKLIRLFVRYTILLVSCPNLLFEIRFWKKLKSFEFKASI